MATYYHHVTVYSHSTQQARQTDINILYWYDIFFYCLYIYIYIYIYMSLILVCSMLCICIVFLCVTFVCFMQVTFWHYISLCSQIQDFNYVDIFICKKQACAD